MGILETIIRRKVMTTVIVLIAAILGVLAYFSMGVRRFPNVEFPMATITTVYPGGSPEEVETEISKRIEDAVSSITGVDEIRSFSQQGMSLIIVQFDLEEDIDIKAMDIRDKLDQIGALLPADAEDPIVGKFDFAAMPVITLALTGPQDINELYRIADEDLENRLAQVSGVANVQVTGGRRREIHVLLNAGKLRKYGVSVDDVAAALRSANLEIPAGHITESSVEYMIRSTGRFSDAEDILSVPVRRIGDSVLEIRRLGRVEDTFEEERSRSRADGSNSIIMSVLKQSGSNDVEISDGIREVLPKLRALLPEEAELFVAEDTSDFVRGALSNVRTNMIIGIILTSIALYLFLNSWRGTVVVIVVMPSALVITFMFMMFSGITVNILTLTALAVAMGIIVNNSILILENSQRFVDQGMLPVEAAIAGTKDIGLAIISSTATNLVVFLPIAFMGEIIGMFFREFGLTIVYVTTVSLFVSFTLTPMMCGALLRRETEVNPADGQAMSPVRRFWRLLPLRWNQGFSRLQGRYMGILGWCLDRPRATILASFLVVGCCVPLIIFVVGMEFFPQSDEGLLRISVETPVGSSLNLTGERIAAVEEIVQNRLPEGYLRHYYARVGKVSGMMGSSSSGTNIGEISVSLVDKAERREDINEILNGLRPHLAEVYSAKIVATAGGEGGPGGAPVSVEITGQDLDELRGAAADVVSVVVEVPGASDVDQSYRAGQPEVRIIPDLEKCGRHNLTVRDLAATLRTYIEGQNVSQFRDRGEDYDIRIRLDGEHRRWAEDVRGMFVKSPVTGEMIPITEAARVLHESGPTVITRKDRRRLITVEAQLTGERSLGDVVGDVRNRLDREVTLPEDVDIHFGGEMEMMVKNFAELFKAMGTAGVLTFLCVAGIIESFLIGTMILSSVPVCLIGVTAALILGGVRLNIFSLMAMIMLVGMVVNNAIIVLDYAMREERAGLSPVQRVLEACRVRFRVIVMANMTTIVAMIPLSLGLGFAGEIFRPLAVVQMGGIFAAATLSMVVIPAVYTWIENRRRKRAVVRLLKP